MPVCRSVTAVLLLVILVAPVGATAAADGWHAGLAKVVITPDEPMNLSGYAGRTEPSNGKLHDLFARAIAIRDPEGHVAVMVSTDLIGVPVAMAQRVTEAVEKAHGLKREQVMLTCSHTHCGPALDDALSYMLFLPDEAWVKIRNYQKILDGKLIQVIGDALADLAPAQLATGIGKAEFASYRRPPDRGTGPFDHEVPVLRVLSADGKQLRGLVLGYACHNTVMDFRWWSGDYAGAACLYLEERHPGATAMFFTGCGADQNPLPRRKVEIIEKYGRMLGIGVEEVLASEMQPVEGTLKTSSARVDLPLEKVPTPADLEQLTQSQDKYLKQLGQILLRREAEGQKSPASYPYPIQVWQLGKHVTWIALGGEITVEYSLRLKQELGQGRTWVTGYANDVMSYIPSERILAEGGYEGQSSQTYYLLPSKWAPGIEDRIVSRALELAK